MGSLEWRDRHGPPTLQVGFTLEAILGLTWDLFMVPEGQGGRMMMGIAVLVVHTT